MSNNKAKKNIEVNNTNIDENAQQVDANQPDEQEQVETEVKKKIDWKGIGKKVLIGVGAVGAAAAAFGAGVLTGKLTGSGTNPESEGSEQSASDEDQSEVTFTEF